MKKQQIKKLTKYIIKQLKEAGFTIQKYEAYSSNSVYLKLDYGVSNSIRISDHHGKKHLQYRYNILANVEEPYITEKNHPRYYYPFEEVDMMIERIIETRDKKITSYGNSIYKMFMNTNKKKNKNNVGFWQKAVEL